MKLKFFFLLLLASFAIFTAQASFPIRVVPVDRNSPSYVNDDLSKLIGGNLETFKKMTPKQFEKMTGKKLTLKETLKLKAAQKMLKKRNSDADIPQGLYIVLSIFGLGWLAMGLMDDWSGNNWIVNLILVILCWLPGVIHALVKMNDYYGDN
jgi:uncharacterized membrane protein YqaE (UPF0057 family)